MNHRDTNHRASTRASRCVRAGLAIVLATAAPAWAAEPTIVVLDGSGSMWGRIDGTPKLEIARATLAEVLADMPAGTEIGLMAYGHNRKGDCDDIEMLVSPRAGAAPEIIEAANAMRFLGMTPLSAAVMRAAEALRSTEQKATVVLVTDGLETCDLDPCAVGRELEAAGVDFTAHVVGFGLSAEEGEQVACLATNTGGAYFAAEDASGLADALGRTVAAAAVPVEEPVPAEEPEPLPATLLAPEAVPMASMVAVEWTGPGARHDFIRIVDAAANHGRGEVHREGRIRPDDGRTVTLFAPTTPGTYVLQYYDRDRSTVLATREIRIDPIDVSLTAQDAVPMGSRVGIEWVGPGARHDFIRVVDPDANHGKGRVVRQARVDPDEGRALHLVAPTRPGEFELQYFNRDDRAVLTTRALKVEPVEVSLSAPDRVSADSRIDVDWVGPGAEHDYIRISDPGANHGRGRVVQRRPVRPDDGHTVTLDVPGEPGTYELQYFNNDDRRVLATRSLVVD